MGLGSRCKDFKETIGETDQWKKGTGSWKKVNSCHKEAENLTHGIIRKI